MRTREQAKKYNLTHRTKRKARINAIKVAAGCADCGYSAHAVALDFDHMPGFTKSFNISLSHYMAWHKVESEIAKCEIVCANCHRVRSSARRET